MDNQSAKTNNTQDPSGLSMKLTQLAINSLDETFDTLSVSSINRKVLAYVSEYAAALNRDFFLRRIDNLESPHKNFIYTGKTTVCDDLNRVSYFHIKLGPYKLPIFQPGTVMFYSGVKNECP